MHTLLSLSSILFITLGCYLTLGILDNLGDWSQRRDVQCLVLAAPIISLGISLGGLCLRSAPLWDSLLGVALPFAMGLVALGALGLGMVRLVLMARVIARIGGAVDPELQVLADDLAKRLGTARSRVLLCSYDRPLALTCGLRRPTMLLSTWMVEHLDHRELEAVLAHKLEHVARHDYLVIWLATVLRDAFFYMPTSWIAYRQLQDEKDLACDDLVVGTTHRPLALASALAKVWLHALDESTFACFRTPKSFVGVGKSISGRIERLLTIPAPTVNLQRSHPGFFRISIPALIMLLLPGTANVALMFALMGCGPTMLLGKLF